VQATSDAKVSELGTELKLARFEVERGMLSLEDAHAQLKLRNQQLELVQKKLEVAKSEYHRLDSEFTQERVRFQTLLAQSRIVQKIPNPNPNLEPALDAALKEARDAKTEAVQAQIELEAAKAQLQLTSQPQSLFLQRLQDKDLEISQLSEEVERLRGQKRVMKTVIKDLRQQTSQIGHLKSSVLQLKQLVQTQDPDALQLSFAPQ
jgi:DNA repair exonuclease SbcCD ATPase subunit